VSQKSTAPSCPFLVMNRYYMTVFNNRKIWTESIRGFAFDAGRFKEDAIIIDADCRKFQVIGARKRGWSFGFGGLNALLNVFYPHTKRFYDFDFLVGQPEHLTFEQARHEIVEHVCARRWASKAGGTPENFRRHHAQQTNIIGVMNSIGFLGKDPF
jgi:hypothetical protein